MMAGAAPSTHADVGTLLETRLVQLERVLQDARLQLLRAAELADLIRLDCEAGRRTWIEYEQAWEPVHDAIQSMQQFQRARDAALRAAYYGPKASVSEVPKARDTFKREHEPVVYFVEAVGIDRVKIGTTTNLDSRISSIRTSAPSEIRVLKTIPGSYTVEAALHKRFGEYRIEREWFRLSPIAGAIAALDATGPSQPQASLYEDGA